MTEEVLATQFKEGKKPPTTTKPFLVSSAMSDFFFLLLLDPPPLSLSLGDHTPGRVQRSFSGC